MAPAAVGLIVSVRLGLAGLELLELSSQGELMDRMRTLERVRETLEVGFAAFAKPLKNNALTKPAITELVKLNILTILQPSLIVQKATISSR
jgi:hypothetical protein